MATTRTLRPVRKLAGATRVAVKARTRATSKKPPLKKSVRKAAKSPSKSSPSKLAAEKSTAEKSNATLRRENKHRLNANLAKRAKTIDETNRVVGLEPIAVDPADEAAQVAIARKQQRLRALADKPDPAPSARIKRTAVERIDDPPPATGMALIERVTQAVERELSQIEVIVGGHHVKLHQRTEAERRARTLASLARTLSEVRRLRSDQEKLKPEDDDTVPRDLDEFRRTLSRRLEQMVRARADVPASGDESG